MRKEFKLSGEYFAGNKASDYAIEHGYLDYATLAKSFDAVMSNDIISKTSEIGYWETESGFDYYYEDALGNRYTPEEQEEKLEELEAYLEELKERFDNDEDVQGLIDETQENIDTLNEEHYEDIFQYYIISGAGAQILEDYTDEIVFYNEELDLYVWGVTHYGTSWDYVLTNIPLNCGYDD